jgi:flagellar basal-body rod protein FlgG
MNGAFYIGAVGLDAQQNALNVVANNIANINTTAFKRQVVQFSALVSSMSGAQSDPATQTGEAASGAGVAVGATPTIWTQGALTQTGQPLDLAIQGDGFLEVLGPAGSNMLWRGGTLEVNPDGYLAVSDGTVLRAMISVPQGAQGLTISPTGAVTAQISGSGTVRQIGQLDIALARDPSSLVQQGSGYYEAPDAGGTLVVKPGEEGGGIFVQGSLETSNVQLTDEMTNLLLVQRAYGASAQVVQAGDQLMSIVNGLRR